MSALWFEEARLETGWAPAVRLETDSQGRISRLVTHAAPDGAEVILGAAIPALSNLHSHAFQRAFAGRAEASNGGPDDFWGWREQMYGFVARLDLDDVEAIAAQAFMEMLKGGYGAVAEFHYLHRQMDGAWGADKAEMALAVARGADAAGIGLRLLPVVYLTAGFDGAGLSDRQKRFHATGEDVADIRQALERNGVATGLALHSLRAVPPDAILRALDLAPQGPIHIHIAEQTAEVEACLAVTGRRPVARLFELAEVDARWCLVHATHMTADEIAQAAKSGAVAGLCPTTEADLGDGLFPLADWEAAQGRLGVGSDSHVVIDAAEEVRLLDYGLRLGHRRRFVGTGQGSRGALLWAAASAGGRQAWSGEGLAPAWLGLGERADIVALDVQHPSLVEQKDDNRFDGLVFCNHGRPFQTVVSGGVVQVRQGRHVRQDAIQQRYGKTLAKLCRS